MQSTVFILDEEQNIKKSYRYDAFGAIIEEGGSLENRITYTGQIHDGVTGQVLQSEDWQVFTAGTIQ